MAGKVLDPGTQIAGQNQSPPPAFDCTQSTGLDGLIKREDRPMHATVQACAIVYANGVTLVLLGAGDCGSFIVGNLR